MKLCLGLLSLQLQIHSSAEIFILVILYIRLYFSRSWKYRSLSVVMEASANYICARVTVLQKINIRAIHESTRFEKIRDKPST